MADRASASPAPTRWVRSPIHVLALLAGIAVTAVGWALATLFEASIVATSQDLRDIFSLLPEWIPSTPTAVVDLGAVSTLVGVVVWLVWGRRLRELVLVVTAMVAAALLSAGAGEALLLVARPELRALFDDARQLDPLGPTASRIAMVASVVALTRPWIPRRSRRAVIPLFALWLLATVLTVSSPPYLGLVLDVGLGIVAGAGVALAFGTPSLQPGRAQLIAGLARSGIEMSALEPAKVDARGSEPWIGTTVDGRGVFVKALSIERRAADLLFRAQRWMQMRRSGDPPPETSLKRAAEHEALVSHHVRSLGLPTPGVLAVADLGDNNVALAYEALTGTSLDRVDPSRITDEMLREIWGHVASLREHGVAHRDLRLANVFLCDDGGTQLIDFGFAELAADGQLLDVDVAELLAATSAVVGVKRAVAAMQMTMGLKVLERARDWLHPLALSRATRSRVHDGTLDSLRTEVERVTLHSVTPYEPIARLSTQRIVSLVLLFGGVYFLLAVTLGDDWSVKVGDLRWYLAAWAFVLSGLALPLAGAAARAITQGQLSRRTTSMAVLAAAVPSGGPTYWSSACEKLSEVARARGLTQTTTRPASSAWLLVGLLTAPPVVAVFAAAGLRPAHGFSVGSVLGLLIGVALAAAEVSILVATPWGRELRRVWVQPYRGTLRRGSSMLAPTLWWIAARVADGLGAALAMRAVGVDAGIGLLAAVAVISVSLAALTPAPGGIGAAEASMYIGLVVIDEGASAGVAVVAARLVGFWLQIPAGWLAHRTLVRTVRHRS